VIKLINHVPEDVKRASEALLYNSVLCVNLGVERENISHKHWVYFYEEDFSFHRISFPMNFSPHVTPDNTSSISTEISYSKYKPLNKENATERVINDLIKAKILFTDDKILVSDTLDMKYAYIIYDHEHRKNVNKIHSFLHSKDIYPCGRFGEWEYFNMDDSLESGRRMAEKINQMNSL
jgi:UDP-galactopyranose mutase